MNSTDDALRALVARGFRFRHHTDAAGEIVSVVATYEWWQFADWLYLDGEDSAFAARIVRSLPGMVVWSYEGDALSTMVGLLRLPGPHEHGAPWRVRHAPASLWPLE